MPLAYIRNPLDRRANDRSDEAWIAAQRASPSRKLIKINSDRTIIIDGHLDTTWSEQDGTIVFLGLDTDNSPWFACASDREDNLCDLRSLAVEGALPPEQLGILAQARSLIQWHQRRSYCSNCGNRNEVADAGYRRHCANCGIDHFPRTDPVVIIVVRRQDRILLGRQKPWAPGMYSALAGFVEPGETIEEAARREVFEEAGIRVGRVQYVTSQPWPFLSNLMIGLIGEATTEDIRLDHNELEDARWFSAVEARMMVERTHPEGLYAANPMAIAHHLVRTALNLPSD
jgi:NAD+ diphosphatase